MNFSSWNNNKQQQPTTVKSSLPFSSVFVVLTGRQFSKRFVISIDFEIFYCFSKISPLFSSIFPIRLFSFPFQLIMAWHEMSLLFHSIFPPLFHGSVVFFVIDFLTFPSLLFTICCWIHNRLFLSFIRIQPIRENRKNWEKVANRTNHTFDHYSWQ